ncbi:MAG: PKD-like domain-containing protein [Bacteroidota bacterium]
MNNTPAGASYSGGTGTSFSVSGISGAGSYVYRCLVSATGSDCATATSDVVTVTVTAYPDINTMSESFSTGVAFTITPENVTNGVVPSGTTYSWDELDIDLENGLTVLDGKDGLDMPNISGQISNSKNVNKLATYTITPKNVMCTGGDFTLEITIIPGVSISDKTTSTCSHIAFSVVPVDDSETPGGDIVPDGTTYSWPEPSVAGIDGEAAGSDSPDIHGTLTNKTNAPIDVIYVVTPRYNSKNYPAFNLTVTVNPEPDLSSLSSTVCSDMVSEVTLSVANSGAVLEPVSYYISSIASGTLDDTDGADLEGTTSISTVMIYSERWNNRTNTDFIVNYSIIPTGANGCTGEEEIVPVTVRPEADLSALSGNVCSDAASGVVLAIDNPGTDVGAVTYTITGLVTGGLDESDGTVLGVLDSGDETLIQNESWTNKTSADVDVVYTITPQGSVGCAADAEDVTVTIRPEPDLSLLSATVCSDVISGIELSIDNPGAVGTVTYTVSSINPNGLTDSDGTDLTGASSTSINLIGSESWTNKTDADVDVVYTITPEGSNGCTGDPETVIVTIMPEVDLSPLGADVCSDAISGITLSIANAWTGIGTITYTVNSITTNGLDDSDGTSVSGATGDVDLIYNESWNNRTDADVNVIYNITPALAGGCAADAEDVTVIVKPEADLSSLSGNVCSDAASDVVLSIDNAGTDVGDITYTVNSINSNGLFDSDGADLTGASDTSTDLIRNESWTNKTNADVDVIYTITPQGSVGCAADAEDVTVTIKPEADLSLLSATVCSDAVSGVVLTIDNSGTAVGTVTYTINSINANGLTESDGTVLGAGSSSDLNLILNEKWTNKTDADVDVVYTITPQGANGCTGDPETVIVTIMPEVDLSPLGADVCSDAISGITLSIANAWTGIGTITYTVNSITTNGLDDSDGTSVSGATGDVDLIYNESWNNRTDADVNVIYNITPALAGGCAADAEDVTVIVKPEADLSSLSGNVCSDDISGVVLTIDNPGTDVGAVTYTITGLVTGGLDESDGTVLGVLDSGDETLIQNESWTNKTDADVDVIYTITPQGSVGCAADAEDVTVTIKPEADLSLLSATVCSDAVSGVVLTIDNAGTDVGDVTYTITALDDNGLTESDGMVLGAGSSGDLNLILNEKWTNKTDADVDVIYTITPQGSNGCTGDPETVIVTIIPEADLSPLSATVCSDGVAGLELSIVNSGTAVGNITYTVNSLNTNGLTDTDGIDISGTSGGVELIKFEKWNNKTDADVDVVYTVTPWGATGCTGDPEQIIVTVRPEADLSLLSSIVCSDAISGVTLALDNSGAAVGTVTYTVNYIADNGLADYDGTLLTGISGGEDLIVNERWTNKTTSDMDVIYTITPQGSFGCTGDPDTVIVTVNPEADLSLLSAMVCSDAVSGVVLTIDNAGAAVGTVTYTINSINANGLTESDGTVLGAGSSGDLNLIVNERWTNKTDADVDVIYTITPRGLNGCNGNPESVTITIKPEPDLSPLSGNICSDAVAGITLSVANSGSVVGTVTYTVNSITTNGLTDSDGTDVNGNSGGDDLLYNEKWTNNTSADVNVIYNVTPFSADVCQGDPETITVTIKPEPDLSAASSNVCSYDAGGITLSIDNSSAAIGSVTYMVNSINDNGLTDYDGTALTGASGGSTLILNDSWINKTNADVNVIYTIIPQGSIGCTGDGEEITVTYKSAPDAVSQIPPTLCEDIYGGGLAAGIDITILEDDIINSYSDRLVTWYSNSDHTVLVSTPTSMTITDGMMFYPLVTNTITGCTDFATVTYHVSGKEPPKNLEITGVAKQGATLILSYDASGSCMPEVESETEITWYRSDTDTGPGARILTTAGTDKYYVITANDLNKYIRAGVKLADGSGVLYDPEYSVLFNGDSLDWVGPVTANDPPTASDATISGILEAARTLTADYDYNDTEGDPEGISVFRWYSKPSLPDEYAEIPGETGKTHVISNNEQGHYFKFSVIPNAGMGTLTGTADTSDGDYGPVNMQPNAIVSDITGDFEVGKPLTGHYTYGDVDGDAEGVSTFRWLRSGIPITGATSITYLLTAEDETNKITFEVTPVALTGFPKTGSAATSPQTPSIAPIVVDFISFRNVYCYDSNIDTISIKNVPSGSSDVKFRMTNTEGFVELIDSITIVIDPMKLTPVRPNSNVVDSLIFSYYERGTTFYISRPFVIDSLGTALTLSNIDPAYCDGAALRNVTVDGIYPLGGTGEWLGDLTLMTDRTTNTAKLNPQLGTAGAIYAFAYQYTSPKLCRSMIINRSVKIDTLPDPDFAINSAYNIDGDPVTLVPVLPGGTFTGNGISGDKLFPDIAGLGVNIITYSVTDGNDCFNTKSKTTTIKEAQGNFMDLPPVLCYIDSSYTFSVIDLPSGMSVNYLKNLNNTVVQDTISLTTGYYNPLKAGSGSDTVTFSYKYEGVDYWLNAIVNVDSLAPVSINNLPADTLICSNRAPFELYPYPDGGVFAGPVTGNYLDPSKAMGDTSVIYTYTSQKTGCSISTTVPFHILEAPDVSFVPEDVCIESSGDRTRFINTTVSEDEVISWKWEFVEIGGAIPVYDENASFLYTKAGAHTIHLTALTKNNCTVTRESIIDLGLKPVGNFYWKNDCYVPGTRIRLFEDTKSDFTLGQRYWDFGNSSQTSTDISPEFTMSDTGYVQIKYIVSIQGYTGCADTVVRSVYLRPTFTPSAGNAYKEDFETGKAGWLRDDSLLMTEDYWLVKDDTGFVWDFGIPARQMINKAASGTHAWFNHYNPYYTETQNQQKASVISPCFDFTEIERPMISMMLFKRFDRARNGAALQYMLEGSSEWKLVGTEGDGINWYNSTVITGSPGGDKIGWTTKTDPDTAWTKSSHKLDMLQGEKNVRFRITYGSDGYSNSNEGMAFDDIWIGDRSRNVLFEHFTNTSSTAGIEATETVNEITTRNDEDVISIQYHTSFPGEDPFNLMNQADVSAKVLSYGIPRVPFSLIDGGNDPSEFANLVNYTTVTLDTNDITLRSLIAPDFKISLNPSVAGGVIEIGCKLTALTNINSNNIVLYLAVIEKENSDYTGIFHNIFRKFIPDAGGIILKGYWSIGDTLNIPDQTWDISNFKDSSDIDIEIIAFVQNSVTKKIYQAASVRKTDYYLGIEEPSGIQKNSFTLYPNPTLERLTISFHEPLSRDIDIKIYDIRGVVISSYKVESGMERYTVDDLKLKGGIYFVRASAKGIDLGYQKLVVSGD